VTLFRRITLIPESPLLFFKEFRMNARKLLTIASLLAFALLVAGFALHEASQAQVSIGSGASRASGGRYQMSVVGREGASTVFVVDSETGNCWYRDTNPGTKTWTDMGSPARPAK
jgi:hypothetical protein